MGMWCFVQIEIHVYNHNGTMLGYKTPREKQGLNIYTDDDNALIIRLYIVI